MQMEVVRRGDEEEGLEKIAIMLILSCQARIKKKRQEETMWLKGSVSVRVHVYYVYKSEIEWENKNNDYAGV